MRENRADEQEMARKIDSDWDIFLSTVQHRARLAGARHGDAAFLCELCRSADAPTSGAAYRSGGTGASPPLGMRALPLTTGRAAFSSHIWRGPSLCPEPTGIRSLSYHVWRGNPPGGVGEGWSAR
jgi:hypothetical protein